MSSARPPLLVIYLLLSIPAARRVTLTQPGRIGVGLVDRQSRSLAIVSLRSPWETNLDKPGNRVRWRLDAYGGDAAGHRLDQLISDWQQLQREHRTNLQITARARGDRLRLSFAWASA